VILGGIGGQSGTFPAERGQRREEIGAQERVEVLERKGKERETLFSQNHTVQKEAIRPIESVPTTIPPRPYPLNCTHLPC